MEHSIVQEFAKEILTLKGIQASNCEDKVNKSSKIFNFTSNNFDFSREWGRPQRTRASPREPKAVNEGAKTPNSNKMKYSSVSPFTRRGRSDRKSFSKKKEGKFLSVYGMNLEVLNLHPTTLGDGTLISVPEFVIDINNVIRKNITLEGIFRKAGSVHRQNEYKRLLNCGKSLPPSIHPVDAACLLKQFLTALPDPLLPTSVQSQMRRCLDLPETEQKDTLVLCTLLLSKRQKDLLAYVLELLSCIASAAVENQMNTRNLAIVMAPNLFPNFMNFGIKTSEKNQEVVMTTINVVQRLIEGATSMCRVSGELDTIIRSHKESSDSHTENFPDFGNENQKRKIEKSALYVGKGFGSFVSGFRRIVQRGSQISQGSNQVELLNNLVPSSPLVVSMDPEGDSLLPQGKNAKRKSDILEICQENEPKGNSDLNRSEYDRPQKRQRFSSKSNSEEPGEHSKTTGKLLLNIKKKNGSKNVDDPKRRYSLRNKKQMAKNATNNSIEPNSKSSPQKRKNSLGFISKKKPKNRIVGMLPSSPSQSFSPYTQKNLHTTPCSLRKSLPSGKCLTTCVQPRSLQAGLLDKTVNTGCTQNNLDIGKETKGDIGKRTFTDMDRQTLADTSKKTIPNCAKKTADIGLRSVADNSKKTAIADIGKMAVTDKADLKTGYRQDGSSIISSAQSFFSTANIPSLDDVKDEQHVLSNKILELEKQYCDIKSAVGMLEKEMDAKNLKDLRENFTSSQINSKTVSCSQLISEAYEQMKQETGMLESSPSENLCRRLGRELKIRSRRSDEHRVMRSPSERKIESIRRRSKELEQNAGKVHKPDLQTTKNNSLKLKANLLELSRFSTRNVTPNRLSSRLPSTSTTRHSNVTTSFRNSLKRKGLTDSSTPRKTMMICSPALSFSSPPARYSGPLTRWRSNCMSEDSIGKYHHTPKKSSLNIAAGEFQADGIVARTPAQDKSFSHGCTQLLAHDGTDLSQTDVDWVSAHSFLNGSALKNRLPPSASSTRASIMALKEQRKVTTNIHLFNSSNQEDISMENERKFSNEPNISPYINNQSRRSSRTRRTTLKSPLTPMTIAEVDRRSNNNDNFATPRTPRTFSNNLYYTPRIMKSGQMKTNEFRRLKNKLPANLTPLPFKVQGSLDFMTPQEKTSDGLKAAKILL